VVVRKTFWPKRPRAIGAAETKAPRPSRSAAAANWASAIAPSRSE